MSASPYFQRAGVVLYLGDARDVLPALPEADLLLTDPPYGVAYRSNFRTLAFGEIANDRPEDRAGVLQVLAAAIDRLRDHRHAYVFGGLDASEAETLRLVSTTALVWDKEVLGSGDLSLPWGPAHEPITFAVYRASAQGRVDGRGRLSARLRRGSVLREQRANACQVRLHPNEKPVGILRQMIESSSMLGETVLDPFAGSGSMLVAAALEGRSAFGVEIEERYCEVAARRLEEITRQADLFAPSSPPATATPASDENARLRESIRAQHARALSWPCVCPVCADPATATPEETRHG